MVQRDGIGYKVQPCWGPARHGGSDQEWAVKQIPGPQSSQVCRERSKNKVLWKHHLLYTL